MILAVIGTEETLYLTEAFRVIILPSPLVSSQSCPGLRSASARRASRVIRIQSSGADAFYTPVEMAISAGGTGRSKLHLVVAFDVVGNGKPSTNQSENTQVLATANYNVAGVSNPLTVTGVSWTGSPAATGGATTLTVTGTGFATNASAFVYYGVGGGQFAPRTVTMATSTQLTVQLLAGDLSRADYDQILVGNSTVSGCNPETVFTFGVSGASLLSIAVTPANPSIAKGLTQQFKATGTYTDTSTQDLTSQVTWSSGAQRVPRRSRAAASLPRWVWARARLARS